MLRPARPPHDTRLARRSRRLGIEVDVLQPGGQVLFRSDVVGPLVAHRLERDHPDLLGRSPPAGGSLARCLGVPRGSWTRSSSGPMRSSRPTCPAANQCRSPDPRSRHCSRGVSLPAPRSHRGRYAPGTIPSHRGGSPPGRRPPRQRASSRSPGNTPELDVEVARSVSLTLRLRRHRRFRHEAVDDVTEKRDRFAPMRFGRFT